MHSINQLAGNNQVGQNGGDPEDSDNDSDDDSDGDSNNDSSENVGRYVPESDDEDVSEYYDPSIEDEVAPDLSDLDIDTGELSMDLDNERSSWGARVRPCLTSLDKIHKHKIQTGQAPAWPFADYLEFEFVKWMVHHDISQGARDKLIKLPIVS
jgi:hypothetical protein